MDIYAYLEKDHRKVSRLFSKIASSTTSKERTNLFLELKQELELHADPENEVFYSALRTNSEGEEKADHGQKEHEKIKKLLKKISKIPPKESVKWLIHIGELKYLVEHHVEEEETELFEEAKKLISSTEAEDMVEAMEKLKEKMRESKSFKNEFKNTK